MPKVRWHPQYKNGVIFQYLIYAYIGHPLLGQLRGSHCYTDTEKEAKKVARDMRKRFFENK